MELALMLFGGLVLLVIGGDSLVRGAVAIARKLGVSPLLIGLTLVGFGTSTPELVTSLQAAFAGSPGIAVGNVVGSNICNILLILGLAALMQPVTTSKDAFSRDGSVVVVASLLLLGVVLLGQAERIYGIVFIAALIGYILYTYQREKVSHDASAKMHEAEAEAVPNHMSTGLAIAFTIGGLVLTVIGARLLVDAAIDLARTFGISETIIGLTIVAVGTSLPELVTSVMAAIRKQADVAFGNILGSNIYNILGIMGVTAVVHPIPIPAEILNLDIWVMLGATALMVWFATNDWKVSRREGGILLLAYVSYIGWLVNLAVA